MHPFILRHTDIMHADDSSVLLGYTRNENEHEHTHTHTNVLPRTYTNHFGFHPSSNDARERDIYIERERKREAERGREK